MSWDISTSNEKEAQFVDDTDKAMIKFNNSSRG
jgi:hypothetical protein